MIRGRGTKGPGAWKRQVDTEATGKDEHSSVMHLELESGCRQLTADGNTRCHNSVMTV